MFTDLDRQMLVVPFTVFAGALTAVGSETTKDEIAKWTAFSNCLITGFQATYTDEAGTTPALDLTLERGTTVLSTLAQLTTNETSARNSGLSIPVSAGDLLNVKGAAVNTDNTFDGLLILIEMQPLPPAPSI